MANDLRHPEERDARAQSDMFNFANRVDLDKQFRKITQIAMAQRASSEVYNELYCCWSCTDDQLSSHDLGRL